MTWQIFEYETLWEVLGSIWLYWTNLWLTAGVVFLNVSITSPIMVLNGFWEPRFQQTSQNMLGSSALPLSWSFFTIFALLADFDQINGWIIKISWAQMNLWNRPKVMIRNFDPNFILSEIARSSKIVMSRYPSIKASKKSQF